MRKVFSLMLLLATILTLTACGDDKEDEPKIPPTLDQFDYIISVGESMPVKGKSLENISWEGDDFVANIDNKGILHGNKIGYTRIYSKEITGGELTNIRVVVEPKNTNYSEPLLYHSGVGGQIKYENGYLKFDPMSYGAMQKSDIWETMSMFIPTYIEMCGLPWTIHKRDNSSIIFKTDKPNSPYVAYLFDEDKTVMGVGVYVEPTKVQSLPEFLNERYLIYDVDVNKLTANFAHAITRYETTIDYIGKMEYSAASNFVIILYMQPSSKSRSSYEDILEYFKSLNLK